MKLKLLHESEDSYIKRLRRDAIVQSSKNVYDDMIGISERLAIVGQYLSDWGFPVDPVGKPTGNHHPFIRVWDSKHKTGVVMISVSEPRNVIPAFDIPPVGPSGVVIEKLGKNGWTKKADLAKPNALQKIKEIVEEMVFLPNQRRDHLVDPDMRGMES